MSLSRYKFPNSSQIYYACLNSDSSLRSLIRLLKNGQNRENSLAKYLGQVHGVDRADPGDSLPDTSSQIIRDLMVKEDYGHRKLEGFKN